MDVSPVTLERFETLFRERTGQQLSAGRRWRIETALGPLLKNHAIDSLDRLAGAIAGGGNGPLATAVVDALLNNETSFFRDGAPFRHLDERLFVRLAATRATTRRLRIWCAGCSTGQEAYSIAMLFADDPVRWQGWTIEILGTDLSGRAIVQARAGVYTGFEIQRGLTVRSMLRWFDLEEDHWRARPALRGRVRFARHNLLGAPPAGLRADLILCRNVMLYLAPDRRRALFTHLASVLAPDGALLLGAGETALNACGLFVPDPEHRGFYARGEIG